VKQRKTFTLCSTFVHFLSEVQGITRSSQVSNRKTLFVEVETRDSCSSHVPNTSTPFLGSNCHFKAKIDDNCSNGVEFYLNVLSSGTFCLFNHFKYQNRFFEWFYTPCGVGLFPPDATCDDVFSISGSVIEMIQTSSKEHHLNFKQTSARFPLKEKVSST
jgi:hypothetical protein